MKYPYVLSSDQHCHAWSVFSTVNPDGVNSRLQIIHDEIVRAAETCVKAGGDQMILAGDLFHQRGEIKPSVFNPTVRTFKGIAKLITTTALPGNHDLEGKDANALGNAMQALDAIDGFNVAVEPTRVGDVWIFPWYQNLDDLRREMKSRADPKLDAVIHAPVNGVIKGLPDHGLEASELAAMGYRRVFSGHYHDHKVMEGGKVVSIGATTHQTWSDPGTKAGFILVYENHIEFHESAAPKFVDLTGEALDDMEQAGTPVDDVVKGNYVRLKLDDVTEKEIKDWRDEITKAGAAGVVVLATKKSSVTARTGAATHAAVSLGSSVEHFIRNDMKPMLADEVSKAAAEVLLEAQS